MKNTVQLSCLLIAIWAFAHIAGAVEDHGWLVQKAVESAMTLADPWMANGNREPDNGNQGPVRSFDGNYEYRGEPRTCINLYHGEVEPGLYVGEHTLKVNRWRRRNCGDGMYVYDIFDRTVYGEFSDVETCDVGRNETVSWDLAYYGYRPPDAAEAIWIDYAYGTMTGTTLTRTESGVITTVIGVLVGLLAL